LSIEVTGRVAEGVPPVQIFLECDDLDATVAALKAKGIAFAQDPTDMDYLWREARVDDPDGHDIHLYYAGKNRLDPPWKLRP
jgi:predicted enzyme related to lactoylglutathione lyase